MGCEFRGKIMVHLRTGRFSQEPRHGLHDRDHIIESESTCGDTTGSFWAVCPGHFWLHVFSHLDETRLGCLSYPLRKMMDRRESVSEMLCIFFGNHKEIACM